ncbi:MAG: hypothetical protein R2817_09395 [Flavobacteriales bacterium]
MEGTSYCDRSTDTAHFHLVSYGQSALCGEEFAVGGAYNGLRVARTATIVK